ncbi:PHP domain-containing protein [Neptuniibacter sp. CAU 1671]|uniref:PHP domain-containing protein n=1 Tax=Neptuniibacter sp. CAU 1671 TaxID=3032593 RepID=UPI0023DBC1D5|nr:PHP domain-containing protein [Neptuniibacter sp. CAU 1671]MDF2181489.1 PHP domain-containing protein [Neptuniibacter sp. CAU 1671]
MLPRYDLHCHSTASDGALTPSQLLGVALERQIEVLALTDHDTVSGVLSLRSEPLPDGLQLIPGVELTCLWEGRVIHLLGLGIDPETSSLSDYLEKVRTLRIERGKSITRRLQKHNLPDIYASACEIAGSEILGRPHIARALVAAGALSSEQEAFKRYLGTGKPCDIKAVWPSLEEAVAVVAESKGVSVIAHPTKYKMTFSKLRRLVADFVEVGGNGVEVAYPGATPDQQRHLLRIADQYQLMVSGGSDFHTPECNWTALGKFPPMLNSDLHVLHHL